MTYRDDLFQANRRVEDLELQLVQAYADREHLAGHPPVPEPAPLARPEPRSSDFCILEWWPILVIVAGTIVYFAGVHTGGLAWVDLPLDVIVPSAIIGAAFYSIDVWIRSRNGNDRTAGGRFAIVLAAIAGAPALVLGFITLGGVLSVVGPIIMLVALISWIKNG